MNLFFTHKLQAFYLTTFCFLPLVIMLFWSASWLEVSPANRNEFTLTMGQFAVQSALNSVHSAQMEQQLPNEIVKPLKKDFKHKKPKHKQHHKTDFKSNKPIPQTAKLQQGTQNTQDFNLANVGAQDSTQFLSYGKNDNPFLRQVKSAIDKSLTYPRGARKMHIEGMVVVEFLWTKHKILKGLKVRKSSGYSILDESALKTIEKASLHFPAHTNDALLQIPIIFTIKETNL